MTKRGPRMFRAARDHVSISVTVPASFRARIGLRYEPVTCM
jgi:hypothetical protein